MKLVDILPLERWEALEQEIQEMSGLNASVFNIDGIRITNNQKWPNRLCPEVKANPRGQSFICAVAHMNLANEAMRTRGTIIEECDAGLLKLLVPIFIGEQFLGAVGACGLLLDNGEVDTFLVNKITGIDDDRLESLAQGIPSITRAKAEELNQFVHKRITRIVTDYQAAQA